MFVVLKILIFTPRDAGVTGLAFGVLRGDFNVQPVLISSMTGSLEDTGGPTTSILLYSLISGDRLCLYLQIGGLETI